MADDVLLGLRALASARQARGDGKLVPNPDSLSFELKELICNGALTWQEHFPPVEDRPLAECIHERLSRLDPLRAPQLSEVTMSLNSLMQNQRGQERQYVQKDLLNLLRNIEMLYITSDMRKEVPPWQVFFRMSLYIIQPEQQLLIL